jgi:tRNA A-37 threonylcarbamoyl transferase component Bud32
MPIDLFRTIQSKIARRAQGDANEATDLDLCTDVEPVQAPAPAPFAAAPPRRVAIGSVLRNRYVIESRLWSVTGTIYKALDRLRTEHDETDRHVALKVLQPEASQAESLAKLRREFYGAQALSHPNIVKVFELDEDKDAVFFTMELIEGQLLSSIMREFHPRALPRPYAWALIREIGAGLVHAHSRDVIHGDLNAQNIMITTLGEVRILGFGAADSGPRHESDSSDDLQALASLSYELLAGERPSPLPDAIARPAGLSRRRWKALLLGLAERSGRRRPSVREWLGQIRPGVEPLGSVPHPGDPKSEPRAEPGALSTRRIIALVAVLALCLVGWVLLKYSKVETELRSVDAVSEAANAEVAATEDRVLQAAQTAEEEPAAVPAPPAHAANKSRDAGAPPARAVDRTERIAIGAASYRIRPGEKFVEIQVHRSSASRRAASFDWWTEPGTALSGADYVPQARTTKSFLPAARTVTLFVKVYSNASGRASDTFYVVIGNPSDGSALGAVTKASVSILAK